MNSLNDSLSFNKENNKQISDLKEAYDILSDKKSNQMKILYLNKDKFHKILYENEEAIKIEFDKVKNKISNYFYLILLIEDNPNRIYYEYSLDFIKGINNIIDNGKYSKFFELIIYKIILALIKNYKQTEVYEEDKDDFELKEIENNILKNINRLKELKDLKLNIKEINEKKIDEIYIEIINMLIRTNKIDDYEYAYKIIKELDLENIDLTKEMLDKLIKTLNNEKNKLNKYKKLEENNFEFKDKIINFYYILLKYILKNENYIYNIDFLLEKGNNFIKIINNNELGLLIDKLNEKNKVKFEYIYKFIKSNSIVSKKTATTSKPKVKDITKNSKTLNNINVIDYYYQIIVFEKFYEIKEKEPEEKEKEKKQKKEKRKTKIKRYYPTSIIETSNGLLIAIISKDMLYIFNNENLILSKEISFNQEIKDEDIPKLRNTNLTLHPKYNKITQNIIEKKSENNLIEIIYCSKNGLMEYTIDLNNNKTNIKLSKAISLTCTSYFEIKLRKRIILIMMKIIKTVIT